jgi:K+-transporting ATPase ATPase C chain
MNKHGYGAAFRLALISLALCGLVFPLVVTTVAQIFMPYQSNGSLVQSHSRNVGSILIAQNFTSPMLFHSRNSALSASGVDPDITLQDAYSQIARIHASTGIPTEVLKEIVDRNVERSLLIAGDPYVNVLRLNLILIQEYPSIYNSFS